MTPSVSSAALTALALTASPLFAAHAAGQCAKGYKPDASAQGYRPPEPGAAATSPGGGKGCAASSRTPLRLAFDYAPPGCEGAYPAGKSRIVVDPRIANCPGSYPVIFFFHGNDGWNTLEVPLNDKKHRPPGAVSVYESVIAKGTSLWGKAKAPEFQPVIAVFLASKGKSETLWPDLDFGELKKTVLAKLAATPETKGVTFSSVSIAAHSGTGCNAQFWGDKAGRERLYAGIYADTCFGLFDAGHQPGKIIAVVSVMDNTPYTTFAKTHDMKLAGKCRKAYRGPVYSCYQHQSKDYYLFYHREKNDKKGTSRNHGWPIGLTLMFALENYFPARGGAM